jgi:hypothetical protein
MDARVDAISARIDELAQRIDTQGKHLASGILASAASLRDNCGTRPAEAWRGSLTLNRWKTLAWS